MPGPSSSHFVSHTTHIELPLTTDDTSHYHLQATDNSVLLVLYTIRSSLGDRTFPMAAPCHETNYQIYVFKMNFMSVS